MTETQNKAPPKTGRRIFLHFHNYELLKLYGVDAAKSTALLKCALLLTKYAILVTQKPLLIQPKYLFETFYFQDYLKRISPLISAGLMDYTGYAPQFDLSDKKVQYRNHELLLSYSDENSYENRQEQLHRLRWIPRRGSSTRNIESHWNEELNAEDSPLFNSLKGTTEKSGDFSPLISSLLNASDHLDGRAFIQSNIADSTNAALTAQQSLITNLAINRFFLLGYLEEFDASVFVDTPIAPFYGGLDKIADKKYLISFRDLRGAFRQFGIQAAVEKEMSWTDLIKLREDIKFSALINLLFKGGELEVVWLQHEHLPSRLSQFTYPYSDKSHRLDALLAHISTVYKTIDDKLDMDDRMAITNTRLSDLKWLSRTGRQATRVSATSPQLVIQLFGGNIEMSKDIKVGDMTNSQIQQDSPSAKQTQSITQSANDISAFLSELKKNMDQLQLTSERHTELDSEIKTIAAQLASSKPKGGIIRESLHSVRNILEGTTGSVVATGLLTQLSQFL